MSKIKTGELSNTHLCVCCEAFATGAELNWHQKHKCRAMHQNHPSILSSNVGDVSVVASDCSKLIYEHAVRFNIDPTAGSEIATAVFTRIMQMAETH